jgi:hypothetical protein
MRRPDICGFPDWIAWTALVRRAWRALQKQNPGTGIGRTRVA